MWSCAYTLPFPATVIYKEKKNMQKEQRLVTLWGNLQRYPESIRQLQATTGNFDVEDDEVRLMLLCLRHGLWTASSPVDIPIQALQVWRDFQALTAV